MTVLFFTCPIVSLWRLLASTVSSGVLEPALALSAGAVAAVAFAVATVVARGVRRTGSGDPPRCLVFGSTVLAIRNDELGHRRLISLPVQQVQTGELLLDENGEVTRVIGQVRRLWGQTYRVVGDTAFARTQDYLVSAGHTLSLQLFRPFKVTTLDQHPRLWTIDYVRRNPDGVLEEARVNFTKAGDGSLLEHRTIEYGLAGTSTAEWDSHAGWHRTGYDLVNFGNNERPIWRWMAIWRVPGDPRRYYKFSESPAAETHHNPGAFFNSGLVEGVCKVSEFFGRPWRTRHHRGNWICTLEVLRHMCRHTNTQLRAPNWHEAEIQMPHGQQPYQWQFSEALQQPFPVFRANGERVYPVHSIIRRLRDIRNFFQHSPDAGPYHAYYCNNYPEDLPPPPVVNGRPVDIRYEKVWWPEETVEAYLNWRGLYDEVSGKQIVRHNVSEPGDDLEQPTRSQIRLWWERKDDAVRVGEMIDIPLDEYERTPENHFLRKRFGGARGSMDGDLRAHMQMDRQSAAAFDAAIGLLGGSWFVGIYLGDGDYSAGTPTVTIGLDEIEIRDRIIDIFAGPGVGPIEVRCPLTNRFLRHAWIGAQFTVSVKRVVGRQCLSMSISEPNRQGGNRVSDALRLLHAMGPARRQGGAGPPGAAHGQKRIHPYIMYGQRHLREGVIAGLVDSDGCKPKKTSWVARDDGTLVKILEDAPRWEALGEEDPPRDIGRSWEFKQSLFHDSLHQDVRTVAFSLGMINGSLPMVYQPDADGHLSLRTYFTGPNLADVSRYVVLPHKRIPHRLYRPHHYQMRPEISVGAAPAWNWHYAFRVDNPTGRFLLDDWTITHM